MGFLKGKRGEYDFIGVGVMSFYTFYYEESQKYAKVEGIL